jgi:NADH-quinone oxidoreductase subunit L
VAARRPGPGERAIEQTALHLDRVGRPVSGLAFVLDPLSAVMILVVTGIGSLIHIYSTAYMHEEMDSEFARYFSYLNLFAAFMLVLVLGANFPVMFVGWEGVGLCSYLLIGFWFKKKSANDAGKKAFVVNRIGDYAFILGMLLLFTRVRHARLPAVARAAAATLAPRPASASSRSPRCCSSSAPPASRRRFRSTPGCPTRWRARRRSRPSSTPRRW